MGDGWVRWGGEVRWEDQFSNTSEDMKVSLTVGAEGLRAS